MHQHIPQPRATHYGLDCAMRITEGQVKEGGRVNEKNLHTVYETVVGALYRDCGYELAARAGLQYLFFPSLGDFALFDES